MSPQTKRVVIILVVLAILGAVGYGIWRSAKLGALNANRAKAKASPTATPSPTNTPASEAQAAASSGDGTVLSATACDDCANAYGQISLSPGNSLSRLPRHLRYEAGKWNDTATFSVSWNMAGSGNNRVSWKTDPSQGTQIEWRRAYLVSYGGKTTEIDLRNHPNEIIFKMGTVRDVALYGVYVAPASEAGPVPSTKKPTLP